nr:MAG TPA: hypothetical protein [Bacteriophage sp.]
MIEWFSDCVGVSSTCFYITNGILSIYTIQSFSKDSCNRRCLIFYSL